MNKSFTYLETGSTDPYYNLAFEEYVLTRLREGNYLILWQNDNTIVVGLNQNTEAEINRAFVDAHGIRVVRRSTGGGAVYHDLGNLNYSFITDVENAGMITKSQFTDPIISALRSLGIDAEASGRNDILANGKKVSGTAQRIDHDRILHHGTLLFDSDPSAVEGALRVDPEKFKAKGIQSVRSRIGNIRPLLPSDMTMRQFWEYLLHFLTGDIVTKGNLPQDALQEIRTLRGTKYAAWEWNFGRSPAADIHTKKRFRAGTAEVCLTIDRGRIKEIQIFGDFLALRPIAPLRDILIGKEYKKEVIQRNLAGFPVEDYLGGISAEELLEILF